MASKNKSDDRQEFQDMEDFLSSSGNAELEKYGVWVKSGPVDIQDKIPIEDDFSLQDGNAFSMQDESNDLLTYEEEQLLEELEDSEPDIEFSQDETLLESSDGKEDLGASFSETDETTSLNEIDTLETSKILEGSDENLDMEEEPYEDLTLDIEDELKKLEISEINTPKTPADTPPLKTDGVATSGMSTVSLEDDELSLEEGETLNMMEEKTPSVLEKIDEIDLQDIEGTSFDEEFSESIFENSSAVGSDSLDIGKEEPVQPNLEQELQEAEHSTPPLDDIATLEEDLIATEERIISSSKDAAGVFAEKPSAPPTDTASILHKIENELLSIRDELCNLKEELSELRIPVKKDNQEGLFPDDNDEAIALTGDELENILNTADITEETGEATEIPSEEIDHDVSKASKPQFVSSTEDIFPEATVKGTEGISLDEAPAPENESALDEEIPLDELPAPENESALDEEIPLDELPAPENESALDEEISLDETPAPENMLSLDEEISLDEASAPEGMLSLDEEISLDETPAPEGMLSLDEEISLDEASAPEGMLSLDEEISLDEASAPEGMLSLDEEISLDEASAPENMLSLDEEISLDEALTPGELDESASEEEFNALDEQIDLEQLSDVILEEKVETSTSVPPEEPENSFIPEVMKKEVISVLSYMDKLLEDLPAKKIEEFAQSEHFATYKKLFADLGLGENDSERIP